MLHVKQIYARTATERHDRQKDRQECFEANAAAERENRKICEVTEQRSRRGSFSVLAGLLLSE